MIEKEDFELSEEELAKLNAIVDKFAENFKKEGEIADGLSVKFSFVPGFGRLVSVSFSGSKYISIEDKF